MSYSALEAKVFGISDRDRGAFENRDYYHDNLENIFKDVPKKKRPYVPSGLCSEIINTSVDALFPEETTMAISDQAKQPLLSEILEQTKILKKLKYIATEGHITGTVALKSVYLADQARWTLDVQCLEAIEVDCDPLDPESILSVRLRFRYGVKTAQGEIEYYWHQERWSEAEYTEWLPQKEVAGKAPDFTEAMVNAEASGPHGYGMIPITIIQHTPHMDTPYGLPMITPVLKAFSRRLAVSLSKLDDSVQLHLTPSYKRINDRYRQVIDFVPGQVYDLEGGDSTPPSLDAIDHGIIGEEPFKYQQALKAKAYEHARVTNPDVEAEMRASGTISSVAWKAFNFKFIKMIKNLRKQYGDLGVEQHIRKILIMGKNLGLPEFAGINPDSLSTYQVELQYPAFFEPTVEEKTAEILLAKEANLPTDELARRIAATLDITRDEIILEIQKNIENERASLDPSPLVVGE